MQPAIQIPPKTTLSLNTIFDTDNLDAMKSYIYYKTNIQEFDQHRRSYLICAIVKNAIKIADYLVENYRVFIPLADRNQKLPLHYAAEAGWKDIAERCYKVYDARISADETGWTPIHYAAFNGHSEVLEALEVHSLQFQANTTTPLHLSAEASDPDCLSTLAISGSINIQDESGKTALHRAVLSGATHNVKKLLLLTANPNICDHEGKSPLYYACQLSEKAMIDLLIDHKANLNPEQWPPLLATYLYNAPEIAALLAAKGASLDITYYSKPLLEIARESRNRTFLQAVSPYIQDMAPKPATAPTKAQPKQDQPLSHNDLKSKKHLQKLHSFILQPSVESFTAEVLEACTRGHWESRDARKMTPWLCVAEKGSISIATKLLQCSIDPLAVNAQQNTALHLSLLSGNLDLFFFLLPHLGKLLCNATNTNHETPLLIAARYGHAQAVQELIEHGANTNIADNSGNTALHLIANAACQEASSNRIVDLLVANKANINAENNRKQSPLLYAWEMLNQVIIERLLIKKANPNSVDETGFTLLIKAVQINNLAVASLAVEYGADRSFKTKGETQTTPLLTACHSASKDAVDLLLDKQKRLHIRSSNSKCADPNGGFPSLSPLTVAILALAQKATNSALEESIEESPEHKIFMKILEAGGDPNKSITVSNSKKITPLALACEHQLVCAIHALLAYKAKPNKRPKNNMTPLEIALKKQAADIVKILLSNGAKESNVKNEYKELLKQYSDTEPQSSSLSRSNSVSDLFRRLSRSSSRQDLYKDTGHDAPSTATAMAIATVTDRDISDLCSQLSALQTSEPSAENNTPSRSRRGSFMQRLSRTGSSTQLAPEALLSRSSSATTIFERLSRSSTTPHEETMSPYNSRTEAVFKERFKH